MRLSRPMPFATSSTLAPASSHTRLTALMNEIFMARKELEACLVSSALAGFMTRNGQLVFLTIGS
jgi:hypothetical protein